MIFIICEIDPVIQVNDKVRISLKKSYKTPGEGAFTELRIKPSASDSFYTVVSGANAENLDYWFLDWQYSTAGSKTITVEVDYGTGPTTETATFTTQVITEAADKLFSSDADLVTHQHDVLNYVPDGRSSWKFMHRRSQETIISYFDEEGLVNNDGSKITKDQVTDISEVKELSIYRTLRLIFESISNSPDDVFIKKAAHWEKYEQKALGRCVTRLDFDKSGATDPVEVKNNNVIVAGRS